MDFIVTFGAAVRFIVVLCLVTSISACGVLDFPARSVDLPTRSALEGMEPRPDAAGQSRNKKLIYVVYPGSGFIAIYNWNGTLYTRKFLGPLNAPEGACSDEHGNVFVTSSGSSTIVEFAHGGTEPVSTLSDPGEYPAACSVDSTSGHLAVINYLSAGGGRGSVSIYNDTNSGSVPETYTDQEIYAYAYCAYDSHGNLFIDGTRTAKRDFEFAELPRDSKTFQKGFPLSMKWPGPMQWDGRYLAVGVPDKRLVYRVSKGKIVDTVRLKEDAGYDFAIVAGEISTLFGRFPAI